MAGAVLVDGTVLVDAGAGRVPVSERVGVLDAAPAAIRVTAGVLDGAGAAPAAGPVRCAQPAASPTASIAAVAALMARLA